MRYIYLLLGLFCGGFLSAQQSDVSATFIIPDVAADNNTTECIPVSYINFSNGIEFSFAIRWDKPEDGGALTFNRVQNLNPNIPFFDLADFDVTSYVNDGLITVEWGNYPNGGNCNDATGDVTRPDNETLFEICFDVSGAVGTNHPVEFFNKPDDDPFDNVNDAVEIIFNKPAQCDASNSAFPGVRDGSVTIGVKPLQVRLEPQTSGIVLPGDQYCVNAIVEEGFQQLKGMQFGIEFDPEVLQSVSATVNADYEFLQNFNFSLFDGEGFFTTWNTFNDEVYDVPNGDRLFTACFEVVGECGERVDLTPGDVTNPADRPSEVNGESTTFPILPFLGIGTELVISDCNPEGFDVIVNCPEGPINFGDTEVCVEFQAGDDFQNILQVRYLISWDPAILEYDRITQRNPALGIDAGMFGDFERDRIDDGLLGFDWRSNSPTNGNSLDPGEVTFAVCFNVVGFGGTSAINISKFRDEVESTTGFFDGLNPTNCAIEVEQPQGVAITFPDMGFSSTVDGCFDLEVTGFNEVTEFNIYVSAGSSVLRYISFAGAFSGITATEITPGLVQLSYNGPAQTIADGGSLGLMCYRAQDDAEPVTDCTPLRVDNTILPSTAVSAESMGISGPVSSVDGEGCVLFPRGFGLIVSDAEGFINSEVCVPVSVNRFTDITAVDTELNFDPNALTFSEVRITGSNWPGLTAANFDATNASIGTIGLNWSTPNAAGLNIAGETDTVQVFELCFNATAEIGCTEIAGRDAANPPASTAGGDGSIIYADGEVCIEDRLIITSINVIPASCAGEDDAVIEYTVAPRPGNEEIFLRTDNPIRFGNNNRVEGVLPGPTNLVFYNSGTTVRLDTSIVVGVDPSNAATAAGGEDKSLSCSENPSTLISSDGNVGVEYALFVLRPNGSRRRVADGDIIGENVTEIVREPGTYVLEVTSEAGCTAVDTVLVTQADAPAAVIGGEEFQNLTCEISELTLSGEGSAEGTGIVYLWERLTPQGEIIDTVGNTRDITVTENGRYRLTVEDAVRGCSSSDLVVVRNEADPPLSMLPPTASLECDGSVTVLTVGPDDPDITYAWYVEGNPNNVISVANIVTVEEAATYVVSLTNDLTTCTRLDTIVVSPSQGVPGIVPPANNFSIACDPDTTLLSIDYTNVDENTDYRWTTDDGQVVIGDFNAPSPRVRLSGTYKVVVSNGACVDSAFVTVGPSVLPTVDAGAEAALSCSEDLQLSGTATSNTSATVSFQWSLNGQDLPQGGAQTVLVSEPGLYFLEARNDASGCTSIDSVMVLAPEGFPTYELADTVAGLGCAPSSVELEVTGDQLDQYQISWEDPDGGDLGTATTATATMPGFHRLTITNPATGCTSVDSVFVEADGADLPLVFFRRSTESITCERQRPIIDASPSADGDQLVYTWSAIVDGEEPETQGNDSLRVSTGGTYRLTIVDTVTMCSNFRDIVVSDVRELPNVTINQPEPLDCDTRSTTVSINVLDQPNDYQIRWSGPFGNTDFPTGVTEITAEVAGVYNATIINGQTSCITALQVRVPDLIDSIAVLSIMQPDSFDCNNETITLDASNSDLIGVDEADVSWTSLDGNNVAPATGSLIVAVDGPGRFVLSVTGASGCTLSDTVSVAAADDTPFAQAGEPLEIECGEMPQLDGTASTPAPLPGILYEWIALDGGSIISGADSPTPFVSGIGTYQLVVTNLANGCSDTSTTVVTIAERDQAQLPADFTSCENTTTVIGNTPPGTSGVWTAFNDDNSTFTVQDNEATITEIGDGLSLIWTLSAGEGCENYSADTITIGPEEAPVANDDVLEVGGQNNVGTVDLLANDQRTGPVTVTILTEPEFGAITSNLNGTITFEAPLGITATTTVGYEVCSNVCDGLCSTATLTIRSDADGANPTVFNAITPNGDGMNDVFIFDILNLRPDEFPDNELIIFNRWGDIIYEAKPYNNNWDGRSNGGQEVPEGTYWYILRLNVGEGDIIRGDVTVVR